MLDIIEVADGRDLNVFDSIVSKAANVLSVQLGDLEYEKDFGVDKKFFLQSDLQFQNESFKAYLVQRLVESQVNVGQVIETIQTFMNIYTHYVGEVKNDSGGLIL